MKCLQIVSILIILIVFMFAHRSDAKVRCPNKLATLNHLNRTYFECPSIYQLQSYTSCCRDKDECCPPPKRQLDLFTLSIIGSILCAIFIVSLVLCVFNPSCLFYNSIRTRHTKDKTSYAHKMGEVSYLFDDMPGENTDGDTVIVPQPLKEEPFLGVYNSNGGTCDSNGGTFDSKGGTCDSNGVGTCDATDCTSD
ncbi:uncharacterized protein LOC141855846 isoform X2 [Brevipalpus obovatus]